MEDFKIVVMKTLKDEKILNETIEILKYIIQRKESEDILALYFKTVFMRPDMLKDVT